jgi:hypothetical protein
VMVVTKAVTALTMDTPSEIFRTCQAVLDAIANLPYLDPIRSPVDHASVPQRHYSQAIPSPSRSSLREYPGSPT